MPASDAVCSTPKLKRGYSGGIRSSSTRRDHGVFRLLVLASAEPFGIVGPTGCGDADAVRLIPPLSMQLLLAAHTPHTAVCTSLPLWHGCGLSRDYDQIVGTCWAQPCVWWGLRSSFSGRALHDDLAPRSLASFSIRNTDALLIPSCAAMSSGLTPWRRSRPTSAFRLVPRPVGREPPQSIRGSERLR